MKQASPSAETQRIAVIIVNYGTADLAIAAVESVLAHPEPEASVEVHLVDNASPGEDAARLRQAHDDRGWGARVVLWPEAENHGFGRGNNVVLRALSERADPPDKVLLLNPDARLENAALGILARALDAEPEAAAAGAAVLRPDRSAAIAAFRFPGPVNEITRMINLGFLNRLVRGHLVALPPQHPAGPVDWVSGASVMFRFPALEQAGFFDPAFFLYFEEVDLMRRLRQQGWQVLYVPQARVVHEEGAATGQFAARRERKNDPAYLYQSWAHYFSKFYGRAGAVLIALAMVPAACINMLHRGLRGRAPTVPRAFIRDQWRYVIWPLLSASSDR